MVEKYTCVLCGGEFLGFGNNPAPLANEGRCCDECNNKVIAERMKHLIVNHELKLQPKYYGFIKDGTKRVELRLYDEKRQKIAIGDTIRFRKEPELTEYFDVQVKGLARFNTFSDLLDKFDIASCADASMTKEELLADLEQFYTKEKQAEYGVVGIIF